MRSIGSVSFYIIKFVNSFAYTFSFSRVLFVSFYFNLAMTDITTTTAGLRFTFRVWNSTLPDLAKWISHMFCNNNMKMIIENEKNKKLQMLFKISDACFLIFKSFLRCFKQKNAIQSDVFTHIFVSGK